VQKGIALSSSENMRAVISDAVKDIKLFVFFFKMMGLN
jgi:hypothetical protein